MRDAKRVACNDAHCGALHNKLCKLEERPLLGFILFLHLLRRQHTSDVIGHVIEVWRRLGRVTIVSATQIP